MARIMQSLYPGTCKTCGDKFQAGDTIWYDRPQKLGKGEVHHKTCGDKFFAPPVPAPAPVAPVVAAPAPAPVVPNRFDNLEFTDSPFVDEPELPAAPVIAPTVNPEPVRSWRMPLTTMECYCKMIGRQCGVCVTREMEKAGK